MRLEISEKELYPQNHTLESNLSLKHYVKSYELLRDFLHLSLKLLISGHFCVINLLFIKEVLVAFLKPEHEIFQIIFKMFLPQIKDETKLISNLLNFENSESLRWAS